MSTHKIPFSIYKKKFTLNYSKSAVRDFSKGTQERVRNSRGKRAIRVRATEGLLYLQLTVISQNNMATYLRYGLHQISPLEALKVIFNFRRIYRHKQKFNRF